MRTAVTVRAALAHLIGWGLITPTPAEQWPLAVPVRLPQELAPPTRF